MQLSLSSHIKIIPTITIIIIVVSLIFSTPIVAYSQLSFIVPNHQQQHAFPITQVASFTKDKPKTTEVKGTEQQSSKDSHHHSSIAPSRLLPGRFSSTASNTIANGSDAKVVIINFDDSFKSQFLY